MKKLYICIFSVLFINLFMSCSSSTEPIEEQNDNFIEVSKSIFQSEQMQLVNLEERTFNDWVQCTGIVDVPPQNRAVITAFYGGYVKQSKLLVGDVVQKGDLLLTIENPEYLTLQKNYLQTKSSINSLKADYERQKRLYQDSISSTKNFLMAESNYKNALAEMNSLAEQLKLLSINPQMLDESKLSAKISIYSPIDGIISMLNISKGTYVQPSNPLMEIIDSDHMHLELDVFEKDLLKLQKEQTILFKVPEAGNKFYKGNVHLIGNSIDQMKRTVKVHGHFHHQDSIHFAVGMFIEAKIAVGNQKLLAIEEEAVLEEGEEKFLLLLEEETDSSYRFVREEITAGESNEGYVPIIQLDDRHINDQFLVGGYHLTTNTEAGGHHH